MKVSQLIHDMDKDDEIVIDDYDAPIDKMTIYKGAVRGIKKDNPVNKMHIVSVCAVNSKIVVLATKPRKRSENGTLPFVSRNKYNELEYKLECLLFHATGGRYSKAGDSIANMCKMVNEHIDRCIEDSSVERRWEENLQRLKNGLFGEYTLAEEYPKTLLRYWKAQLDAGHPNAKENVLYFEELVRKESENGK